MTFDPNSLTLTDPTQVWLEVSDLVRSQAWQRSQACSHPSSRWNAYLNQVCLQTILPWLREEHAGKALAVPSFTALPSIWEFVNGTGVAWDRMRIVLVPTETIDLSELRVPQEWVDIPDWVADYYFGIQVDPDCASIRIWGYATHEQLKQNGSYDSQDRSYCLDEAHVIQNMSVLWVGRQLGITETTRRTVATLPAIPLAQAENLIPRLGNSEVVNPRLAVPFQLWGALISHGGWRQKLYHHRLGHPEQWSVLEWLQTGVSDAARQMGWGQSTWQPAVVAAARGTTQFFPEVLLTRHMIIAQQQYELRVMPRTGGVWRFELRHAMGDSIPAGFTLRLLTEDLQAFEGNEDTASKPVECLFVEVSLAPGEGLVWEIEPTPINYDREILRF